MRLAERGAPLEEPDVVRALLAVGAVEQADAYRMLGQSPGTDWAAEGEALRRLVGVEELASGGCGCSSPRLRSRERPRALGTARAASPGSPREALRALDQRLGRSRGSRPSSTASTEEASSRLAGRATLLLPVGPSGTPRGPAASSSSARARAATWPLGMSLRWSWGRPSWWTRHAPRAAPHPARARPARGDGDHRWRGRNPGATGWTEQPRPRASASVASATGIGRRGDLAPRDARSSRAPEQEAAGRCPSWARATAWRSH